MFLIRSSLVAACFGLIALAVPAAAQTAPDCVASGIDDKCESWVATYDDDEISPTASETASDIAVAPDGSGVYSLMRATVGSGFDGKGRWVVIAYTAAGEERWRAIWGETTVHNIPTSIAVSPDGAIVYVSGTWKVDQVAADGHLTTLALDATNGDILWSANYDGPGNSTDNARDIMVSPDGRTLYVAGISGGAPNGNLDYLALAYDASTGAQKWATRWDGIGVGNDDSPFAMDVNARGSMLYFTGWSYGEGEYNNDYGTIAVHTSGPDEGSIAWTARYDGVGVHAPDQASALAVSPDDSKLFVTGMSDDVDGGPPFDVNYGYATVAYNALTGEQLWESRMQWPDTTFNSPTAIAVDPTSERVIVTGQAGQRELDFGTIAYNTSDGTEAWSERYGLENYDFELGRDIAIDPRGDTAYITGISAKSPPGVPGVVVYAPNADQLTIAYDIASGEKNWLARFNPSTTDFVSTQAVAISPDAETVYTAASVDDQNWDYDGDDFQASVMAYDIGPGIPIPDPPATHLEFVGDLRGDYSDDGTLTARLTNSYGDPIEGANVNLGLGDDTRALQTDDDGIVELTSTLDGRPGDYPVEVSYAGEDGVYSASNAADTYAVDTEDVLLTLKLKKASRSLKAVLVDADSDQSIAGRTVTFYAGRTKLGTARTDASGVATRSVPRSISLDRNFKAVFAGDDFYRPASAR